MGVNFLEGFMDSSIILVSQAKGKKEPTFGEKFVSWTGPLDAGVWCMVLLLSVCVGSAYVCGSSRAHPELYNTNSLSLAPPPPPPRLE